jgi:YidC/Oxa1 family membrane protein insertase
LILIGNLWLQSVLHPVKKAPPGQQANEQAAEKPGPAGQPGAQEEAKPEQAAAKPPEAQPSKAPAQAAAEAPEAQPQWFTLGSVDPDPKSPYRLMVTLTNHGAAVERIEISNPKFRDFEDRSGYLGRRKCAARREGERGRARDASGQRRLESRRRDHCRQRPGGGRLCGA